MKKSKKLNKSYKGISSLEQSVISLVKDKNMVVFGVEEIFRLSDMNKRQVYNILFSLNRKGFLTRLKRDCYVLKNEIPGRKFEIATNIVNPSYVSFWSALSFYGFTEQQPNVIQLVSTKQVKDLDFCGHKVQVTTFTPPRFFGYKRMDDFNIAEKEKCLIDSLSCLEKVGGINEFSKCMKNAWDELDREKFVDFLLKFENSSMVSRAGFLIEKMGLKLKKKLMDKIMKNVSKGFVKLDSASKKTKEYDKKWRVNINAEIRKEVLR